MGDIPAGDPTNGAKIFKQRCAQCHTTEKVVHTSHDKNPQALSIAFSRAANTRRGLI